MPLEPALQALAHERVGHREDERAVDDGDRLDAREPGPPRRVRYLGVDGLGALFPELLSVFHAFAASPASTSLSTARSTDVDRPAKQRISPTPQQGWASARTGSTRILPCRGAGGEGRLAALPGSRASIIAFTKGRHEADVPAKPEEARQAARLPPPYGHASWPRDHPGAPPARPGASLRLSRRPCPVRGRETFQRLLREGRRARTGAVTVHFLPAHGLGPEVSVAYSIGRRFGGAVERNHCRRQLRVIANEVSGALAPGAYLIGVAPQGRGLAFQELRELVTDAMRKASGQGR